MPASQEHITDATPMGAGLVAGGVTMRFWAPNARQVYLALDERPAEFAADEEMALVNRGGVWSGFFPGVGAGRKYRFYVVGAGGAGFKRDPRARELELYGYPDCDALVTDTGDY